MRTIDTQTTSRSRTGVRVRTAARAAHLRVIERIGPSRDAAADRVVPFHRHLGPKPAA